jgi:hypothetical protein
LEFLSTTKSLQWLDNQYSFETAVLNRVSDRRIRTTPVCFFSEDPNRLAFASGGMVNRLPTSTAQCRLTAVSSARCLSIPDGSLYRGKSLDRHFDVVNWNQPHGAQHQLAITDIVLTGPL